MNISGGNLNIYNLFLRNVISVTTLSMEDGAVGLLPTLFISLDINNLIFHNFVQPPLILVLKHESRSTCCCHYF